MQDEVMKRYPVIDGTYPAKIELKRKKMQQ